MADHTEIIGRADVNDLEAILAITNSDVDEISHAVHADADAIFTWDYERSRPALAKLYEKAKTSQWNAERPAVGHRGRPGEGRGRRTRTRTAIEPPGHRPLRHAVREVGRQGVDPSSASSRRTGRCRSSCTASRARSICTAQIVETVPWIDAKYYAATQVMDEARHVEVFARYLDTKLSGHYPINAHLEMLLDDIIARLAVGHDLPRHADHGRGPRARRVRVHPPDDHRAAAQAAAPLRHERRGPPRRVRRALAAGVLPAALEQPRSASARSSPSKPRCACATASSSRRRGSASAST